MLAFPDLHSNWPLSTFVQSEPARRILVAGCLNLVTPSLPDQHVRGPQPLSLPYRNFLNMMAASSVLVPLSVYNAVSASSEVLVGRQGPLIPNLPRQRHDTIQRISRREETTRRLQSVDHNCRMSLCTVSNIAWTSRACCLPL